MTRYTMTEYNTDREPKVTHWTQIMWAKDTARAILWGQNRTPAEVTEHPHLIMIAADFRCSGVMGTSVFTIVKEPN